MENSIFKRNHKKGAFMKKLIISFAMALLVPGNAFAQAASSKSETVMPTVPAGNYVVDANHTQVTWKLNHMGFSYLQGQFGATGGTIIVDQKNKTRNRVEVTFNMTGLKATSAPFETHLKSKDFFEVEKYPTAKFVSQRVILMGKKAIVHGMLTIKDVTKPVTLQADFVGSGVNPMSKKLNFGFKATGKIKRTDFGLGMAVPAVGDEVELEINAAFTA
jgi:polyisoprenoid-binding protein YceI